MAWAIPEKTLVGLMTTARLDFATMYEEDGELPPLFFRNLSMLYTWAISRGLLVKRLAEVDCCGAYRISGQYRGINTPASWGYDQIWVRVACNQYRTALQTQALSTFNLSGRDLSGIHADHVINRARLKEHLGGWVCLFPVPARANTHFGSVVERKMPPVPAHVDRIDLSPLVAFKLFCGVFPRSPIQLEAAMKDIRGQWHTPFPHVHRFIDAMQAEAMPYMTYRKTTVRKKPRGYVMPPISPTS
ncbi:hypothetical protein [Rhizobium sp. BR 315]|uniref:hypothetical protein n=1 Tax=Rhizobium sp. BR 315 TaxID=3040014 RepID=UPI003D324A4F